jgi:hypothetical protein
MGPGSCHRWPLAWVSVAAQGAAVVPRGIRDRPPPTRRPPSIRRPRPRRAVRSCPRDGSGRPGRGPTGPTPPLRRCRPVPVPVLRCWRGGRGAVRSAGVGRGAGAGVAAGASGGGRPADRTGGRADRDGGGRRSAGDGDRGAVGAVARDRGVAAPVRTVGCWPPRPGCAAVSQRWRERSTRGRSPGPSYGWSPSRSTACPDIWTAGSMPSSPARSAPPSPRGGGPTRTRTRWPASWTGPWPPSTPTPTTTRRARRGAGVGAPAPSGRLGGHGLVRSRSGRVRRPRYGDRSGPDRDRVPRGVRCPSRPRPGRPARSPAAAGRAANLIDLCLTATTTPTRAAAAGVGGEGREGTTAGGVDPRPPALLVRAELSSLLGRDGLPAGLLTTLAGGTMHVDAATARRLVDRYGTDLRLVLLDDGHVVGVGTRTRRPPGGSPTRSWRCTTPAPSWAARSPPGSVTSITPPPSPTGAPPMWPASPRCARPRTTARRATGGTPPRAPTGSGPGPTPAPASPYAPSPAPGDPPTPPPATPPHATDPHATHPHATDPHATAPYVMGRSVPDPPDRPGRPGPL